MRETTFERAAGGTPPLAARAPHARGVPGGNSAPAAGCEPRVRRLTARDAPEAARLASEVFRENRFYRSAIGFDAECFDAYWTTFIPLAVSDPHALSLGVERHGRLVGILVLAFEGFPSRPRALRFMAALARAIGPLPLLRYARFVRHYESAMRRPHPERALEARGLWLLVSREAGCAGLGARLVRAGWDEAARSGRTISTGFVDAGDRRLLLFYRRLGFDIGTPFSIGAVAAATIVRRAPEAPC